LYSVSSVFNGYRGNEIFVSGNGCVLGDLRLKLHRIFNLSLDRPRLRPSQSLFSLKDSRFLRNPHEKITNYKPVGHVSLVKGSYDYHHYMQEGFDDCGWGCAYRSLQTIWSWFNYQGFTEKPVPTHQIIQQSLVDCGDKSSSFVGSRHWIGSTELGFCLNNMLGIESRIITTNSGSEVADNVRQLAVHFETAGTPVMIGGGQLAHTILGVDFNPDTGDCAFLVLDPHYTGEDLIQPVLSKGWCGWKTPGFWKPEYFYNLLLPTPPSNII
uniref:Ufm1-specific protease n=1 Tax=Enterobius vermicularis TaxID=51028 RepID=A0A0N4VGA4_ENTVE